MSPNTDRTDAAAVAAADDVLAFWLGDDPAQPLAHSSRWFERSDALDEEIRRRYAEPVERAGRGELDGWLTHPRGALALVILLDQFPRNLHRDSALAFACDGKAQRCTLDALGRGLDAELTPVQRWFLYMPLMHAEERGLQARCMALFDALVAGAPEDLRQALTGAREFALRHREVVERFERFPHRNAVLGRKTTPEEQQWLADHPSGF